MHQFSSLQYFFIWLKILNRTGLIGMFSAYFSLPYILPAFLNLRWRLSLYYSGNYMTGQMDAYSSCWLLSFLSHTDLNDSFSLYACGSLRLGSASSSSVWLHGRAVVTLFLTLVPVLVYLLSGMWSYVSLNLSESTCPSVTWATGQHTQTHTSTVTHRQTA